MIRQEDKNGVWLFPQATHAFLCGQMAEQWIASPIEPASELRHAIANHDAGWQERDRAPIINEQGQPRTFTELDINDHFTIWERSITRNFKSSRYAGLMVSLHASSLYEKRLARERDDATQRQKIQTFIDNLAVEQEKTRESLQPTYGELVESSRLTQNRELLQAFDWMSLMLCMGGPRAANTFPTGWGESLTASVDDVGVMRIDPWPFEKKRLTFRMLGRYLLQKKFASDAALRDKYHAAPRRIRAFLVVPGG